MSEQHPIIFSETCDELVRVANTLRLERHLTPTERAALIGAYARMKAADTLARAVTGASEYMADRIASRLEWLAENDTNIGGVADAIRSLGDPHQSPMLDEIARALWAIARKGDE